MIRGSNESVSGFASVISSSSEKSTFSARTGVGMGGGGRWNSDLTRGSIPLGGDGGGNCKALGEKK